MSKFFFDLETFLIAPAVQAPPIVCLAACNNGSAPLLFPVMEARSVVEKALKTCTLIGHNVSFDLACICAQWPDLTPLVFQAYAEDRVTDTMVRQKLIDIGRGRQKNDVKLRYDLGSVSERCGGPKLDKEDPWRLKYGTLINTPISAWPQEAVSYALNDAEATRAVYQAQETHSEYLADQYRQARAAWVLRLMEAWGLATDRAQAERYIEHVQKTLEEDKRIAQEAKIEVGGKLVSLVRDDGTKNMKAAQAWMRKVCEESEEKCPLTETGLPSLSEEAVEEHGDFVLEAFQRYANANTRTKRAVRLLNSPIQASFNVLVNTGRTSCSQGDKKKDNGAPSAWGAQIQNPSKDKGYREVFVARPGTALVSIDYDALELRTFSQVCLWIVGFSKLAEVLNEGRDPHTELGATLAGISVEEAYKRKKDPTFANSYRFFSKAANFGYPGGLGPAKFIKSLVKQAVHGGDPETVKRAKSYTLDDAKQLKNAWLRTWPEAPDYFRWANRLLGDAEQASFTHFKSKRARGGMYYCQLCNTPFQGLAADLVKDSLWRCTREMYVDKSSPLYGCRLVNMIHDEGLFEVPLDRLHDAAYRARDIMCETAKEWAPDLTFTAEPAAMNRWSKNARTLKDLNGKLIVDLIEV